MTPQRGARRPAIGSRSVSLSPLSNDQSFRIAVRSGGASSGSLPSDALETDHGTILPYPENSLSMRGSTS